MNDSDLLQRFQSSRQAMLDICGYDSDASRDERHAAFRAHLDTLRVIKERFPDIAFPHSTAEWHLHQAINIAHERSSTLDDAV